jgi:hypothetical protein
MKTFPHWLPALNIFRDKTMEYTSLSRNWRYCRDTCLQALSIVALSKPVPTVWDLYASTHCSTSCPWFSNSLCQHPLPSRGMDSNNQQGWS